MNRRIWGGALLSAGLAALAILALSRLIGGGGRPAPASGLPYDNPETARALIARIERKHRIACELAAGRLSLFEAAAAFRDLEAEGPPSTVMCGFPDASSEDEAHCRSVIEYVRMEGRGIDPDGADDRARCFEEDLDARLRDGTLRLPDTESSRLVLQP